jgi:hypothetical protein
MTIMPTDAVVAGLICLDIIPRFPDPVTLAPGKVTEIGAADLATGGAVANTGLALHLLGRLGRPRALVAVL